MDNEKQLYLYEAMDAKLLWGNIARKLVSEDKSSPFGALFIIFQLASVAMDHRIHSSLRAVHFLHSHSSLSSASS